MLQLKEVCVMVVGSTRKVREVWVIRSFVCHITWLSFSPELDVQHLAVKHLFSTKTVSRQRLQVTYLLHGAESFLRSQLVLQLIKKFPAFYATPKFITVLTSAPHLFLP